MNDRLDSMGKRFRPAIPNLQCRKARDGLVAILAFGAGSVDISFLTPGVFASFMSGNTITLGLGIGGWNIDLAIRFVTAIVSYVTGVR